MVSSLVFISSRVKVQQCKRDGSSRIEGPRHTLNERGQHLAPRLEQRVPDDDLEELLQAGPAALDDVVAEAVGEDLSRQGGDGDAGALALEDVAEVLEVGVPAADAALAQLEGGDVGAADDLVVGVHGAPDAVRSRVAHLSRVSMSVRGGLGKAVYVGC